MWGAASGRVQSEALDCPSRAASEGAETEHRPLESKREPGGLSPSSRLNQVKVKLQHSNPPPDRDREPGDPATD